MVRRTRADMEQTRATLLETARQVFSERGYGETSMDDLTAQANLTRGALYHHFGDKKGLLAAVIAQIDAEMDARLHAISDTASDPWEGFRNRCRAYLEMAREPEIQRIVLLDGPAVLGDPSRWPSQLAAVRTVQRSLEALMDEGTVSDVAPEATARLISGAALNGALWIANADDPREASRQVVKSLEQLLSGLKGN
jgi:AcrR family transcriptional regulator